MSVEFNLKQTGDIDEDETDLKISRKTKERVRQTWKIVMVILCWVAAVLFIWDCVASFLIYVKWKDYSSIYHVNNCLKAWLAFSCLGSVLALVNLYNAFNDTVYFFFQRKLGPIVPHQYFTFITYYTHEIPKAVIFLTLVIGFSIMPEMVMSTGATEPPRGFLGHTDNDHIYFKVTFDVLKMVALLALSMIEFYEISKKDRLKAFLVLNLIGAFLHCGFLISSSILKIIKDIF